MIKVDLPDPLTPVTNVKVPKGKLVFTFFKVFPVAPLISIDKPLPFLRYVGTAMAFLPAKYKAVSDFNFKKESGVPAATTWPP